MTSGLHVDKQCAIIANAVTGSFLALVLSDHACAIAALSSSLVRQPYFFSAHEKIRPARETKSGLAYCWHGLTHFWSSGRRIQ